jgi:hypothetical protein
MDGCNQMKVIVAHRRIWSMHPRCQQEPEPTDFHESNENQAKEPFSLNYRSRARPNLENIRVGQMFAKDN